MLQSSFSSLMKSHKNMHRQGCEILRATMHFEFPASKSSDRFLRFLRISYIFSTSVRVNYINLVTVSSDASVLPITFMADGNS